MSVEFTGHRDVVFCVAWQPDGQRIASAGRDGESCLRSRSGTHRPDGKTSTLPRGPTEYFAVAFSPDGRYLVTGRANGTVQVWDARTGEEVGTLGTHDRRGPGGGVQPRRPAPGFGERRRDGQTVGRDPLGQEKQEARHHPPARAIPGQCLNVAFSPDGRRLATGGEENTVKIWDVQTGQELQTLRGHSGDVYTVAFSPDAAGGSPRRVRTAP